MGFRIAGIIDRLDISGDHRHALVRDYKTGRVPKNHIVLDRGKELQRCLYAFAVKALLGNVAISASLLYLREPIDLRLIDPDATLAQLSIYLRSAREGLAAGNSLMGPDTGGAYDDLAFALPAKAGASYCADASSSPLMSGSVANGHNSLGGRVMNAPLKALADDDARRAAIAVHDRSLLVEAGAGSGKTAVMAGRIALMLAQGIAPKLIAAVTFTELGASELPIRVRDFVDELGVGQIPSELRIALPEGLSQVQQGHLSRASAAIDEMTCSTIHGFCQRLIKPYPVEADIDPGASVMDRTQVDLDFIEITETWLRSRLSETEGGTDRRDGHLGSR